MHNNTLKRIISAFLAMIMIVCISLSDVYHIYEVYAEDSADSEAVEESIQQETIAEAEVSYDENKIYEFEYHSDDFSAKLQIESNAVFSIENEPLNYDDVIFSVTAINEKDERLKSFIRHLLMMNILFCSMTLDSIRKTA